MKKKVITVLVLVLVLALVIGGIVAYAKIPHALNYDIESIEPVGTNVKIVSEGDDFVTITKQTEGDFKVLMFTDIHLDGNNKTSKVTVSNLVSNIQKEKPDLVILGGDSITSALNKKRTHQLAQIFEKLGVYWAECLGNHEGDNNMSISREKMVDIFSSYDHCLMRQGLKDVDGNGNYVVTILNKDGSVKESFFFMDTHSDMLDEMKEQYGVPLEEDPYDGLYESQVNWYKSKLAAMQEESGNFKSIAVIHIPLPQYEAAAEGEKFVYGGKLENICESGFDSGLFEAIKEGGSTQAVFCGHDHLNNFGVMYKGVMLSYIEPSGYGSYTAKSKLGYEEKDWLQGYTMLTIKEDGKYLHEFHRNSENMK